MKKNKALLVLNIIIFVILLLCLVYNTWLMIEVFRIEHESATNPDAGPIELAYLALIPLQIILMIPYAVSLIISIVSMCKKYFNWLSITNAVLCVVAIVIVAIVLLSVGGNPA